MAKSIGHLSVMMDNLSIPEHRPFSSSGILSFLRRHSKISPNIFIENQLMISA